MEIFVICGILSLLLLNLLAAVALAVCVFKSFKSKDYALLAILSTCELVAILPFIGGLALLYDIFTSYR